MKRNLFISVLFFVLVFLFSFEAKAQSLETIRASVNGLYNRGSSDGNYNTPAWTTTVEILAQDIAAGDSLVFSVDMAGYKYLYIKWLATTFRDSTVVEVGTSDDLGWATGNTAFFDFDSYTSVVDHWHPISADLATYGRIMAVKDNEGMFIVGPYVVFRVKNNSLQIIEDITIVSVKEKP